MRSPHSLSVKISKFLTDCVSNCQIMKEWAEADNESKNLPKSERQALNEVNLSFLPHFVIETWEFVKKKINSILAPALLPFLHQHFQSVLQTLEEQVAGERQRLVETHLARVQAILNNNRRLTLENYLTAVKSDPPQVSTYSKWYEYEMNFPETVRQFFAFVF